MLRTLLIRHLFCRSLSTTPRFLFPESLGLLPNSQSPISHKPLFFNAVSAAGKQLPAYRVIDGVGNVIEGGELPEVCLTFGPFFSEQKLIEMTARRTTGTRDVRPHLPCPNALSQKSFIVIRTWFSFPSSTTCYIIFSVKERYPSMYVVSNPCRMYSPI
jgi:hypothetical protein